ncbi:hypothetical protein QR680_016929 [Steinernema hermaphroditum]|uniref:Uncharacterized protein n=1 Tax=Steinernema hermaphroditum TaxID=289476 RepID=A0AA39LN47_9BILA|nr:hypothetical protein QR680_016929 [Steinernema hermaphroditum]
MKLLGILCALLLLTVLASAQEYHDVEDVAPESEPEGNVIRAKRLAPEVQKANSDGHKRLSRIVLVF